jgi:hypothetical protein
MKRRGGGRDLQVSLQKLMKRGRSHFEEVSNECVRASLAAFPEDFRSFVGADKMRESTLSRIVDRAIEKAGVSL